MAMEKQQEGGYYCAVHRSKPKVCKNFPSSAAMIKEFPSCSFTFDKSGVRFGECNNCGECCKKPYLYLPEFKKKFMEEPCPYLQRWGLGGDLIESGKDED